MFGLSLPRLPQRAPFPLLRGERIIQRADATRCLGPVSVTGVLCLTSLRLGFAPHGSGDTMKCALILPWSHVEHASASALGDGSGKATLFVEHARCLDRFLVDEDPKLVECIDSRVRQTHQNLQQLEVGDPGCTPAYRIENS